MNLPTAADIMDRSEPTFPQELDVATAMRKLLRAKLNGVPVVDSEGRLCGMLTEQDCLKALVRQATDGAPGASVRDYMTTTVESVVPTTQLLDIAHLFLKRTFRKLPVVDSDGRVVGQVSRRDILKAIDSAKDNAFLYGAKDQRPGETGGVHSAMERARGKS
ncbi:MAG: CBS domain-containing protein [Deltaproteobacteria bacterium]|nr:CBS domain-containing protein [Deltaproteobacteria bacterium]